MVGSTHSKAHDLASVPKSHNVYGTFCTDKAARRHIRRNRGIYTCLAEHGADSQFEPPVFTILGLCPSNPAGPFCHGKPGG